VRIARLMSAARMADLMLTGRVLSTEEAERVNLIQYPVPAGQAMDKATELAERIASNAPIANYAVTNALPRIQDLSHDDGLFFESAIASLTCGAPETVARLNEFLEKRADRLRLPEGVKRRSG
jgi:enoyl-CoA hydratase/carnithine racemase